MIWRIALMFLVLPLGGASSLKLCSGPGCENVSKMKCSQCKQAFYCNKTCQLNHWKAGHSTQCKKLAKPKAQNQETNRIHFPKQSSLEILSNIQRAISSLCEKIPSETGIKNWAPITDGGNMVYWHQCGFAQCGLRYVLKRNLQEPFISYGFELEPHMIANIRDQCYEFCKSKMPRGASDFLTFLNGNIQLNLQRQKQRSFSIKIAKQYEENGLNMDNFQGICQRYEKNNMIHIDRIDLDKKRDIFPTILKEFDLGQDVFLRIFWPAIQTGIDHEFSVLLMKDYVQIYTASVNLFTIPKFLNKSWLPQKVKIQEIENLLTRYMNKFGSPIPRKQFNFPLVMDEIFETCEDMHYFHGELLKNKHPEKYKNWRKERLSSESYWKNMNVVGHKINF